jgi:2-amino-4-hydroxy-6-hydroxymethyldihydropteridine diphosphokinase
MKIKSNKIYTVTLGIGGNVGNVTSRFKSLFIALTNDIRFDILRTSPILKNPPFGFFEQNDFLNSIIVAKTNISPLRLLKITQYYEKKFKRIKTFQDAPRTLDIDIIFIKKHKKNIIINTRDLKVPHVDWRNRPSVMIPLEQIKCKNNGCRRSTWRNR